MRTSRLVVLYATLIACFLLVDCQYHQFAPSAHSKTGQNEVVYKVPVRIPNRRDRQYKSYVYLVLLSAVFGRAALDTLPSKDVSINDGNGGGNGGGNGPTPTG